MALRELKRAHRLPVALGIGHPEVPLRALLDVASFLVADEHDRPTVEAADPADDRRVVRAGPIAVQLDEVIEQPFDIVERVRPLGMAGELDRAPDLLPRRLGLDALEVALQPFELAGDLRSAEEGQAPEPAQPLPQ